MNQQPTPGPWEVYLCGDQGPDQACGIRTTNPEAGVRDMVVSDTARDECCHMMKLADAELIVEMQRLRDLYGDAHVITVKGDMPSEQFKEFRDRWMQDVSTARPLVLGLDVQYLRTDSIGTCKLCGYEGPGPKHDCKPLKTVSVMDQPPPKATTLKPCWPMVIDDMSNTVVPDGIAMTMVDLVIADMTERDSVGRARYGVPLTADNGRDQLVDAYQEGLDQAVYTRAFLEENADHDRLLARMTVQAMRMIYTRHLQHLMIMRDIIETRRIAQGSEAR